MTNPIEELEWIDIDLDTQDFIIPIRNKINELIDAINQMNTLKEVRRGHFPKPLDSAMSKDPRCNCGTNSICSIHPPVKSTQDSWGESYENIEPLLKAMKMYNGTEFCALCGLNPKKLRSNIKQLLAKQREEIIRWIEEKFGKEGTRAGSLGYQGTLNGIHSFQTPEDVMRDKIITKLKRPPVH